MKKGIHPEYKESVFRCACGAEVATRSLQEEYRLEICSHVILFSLENRSS